MTFLCFPKSACEGKKDLFFILKGKKVPKVLKRERKVQKREREKCKKDIASIPTYFEIQCLSNEGFLPDPKGDGLYEAFQISSVRPYVRT